MVYISSDTNVWIDFMTIDSLDIPFKLPFTYIMSEDAVEDELWSQKLISVEEYEICLRRLDENNGGAIRLPREEILSRIKAIAQL